MTKNATVYFTKAITVDNVDNLTEEQIIKRALEAYNMKQKWKT